MLTADRLLTICRSRQSVFSKGFAETRMQKQFRSSLALGIGCGILAFAAIGRACAQSDGFETVVKPVIQQSCGACHNAAAMTGGLDLSRFLKEPSAEALKDRDVWEKVI